MSIVSPRIKSETGYDILVLPYNIYPWQFDNYIEHIKRAGYIIVGMISDIDKQKNIIIIRDADESQNTSNNR